MLEGFTMFQKIKYGTRGKNCIENICVNLEHNAQNKWEYHNSYQRSRNCPVAQIICCVYKPK